MVDINGELIRFLDKEVPNSISEIRESLDLLLASIENSIGELEDRVTEEFRNRNFTKASEIVSRSKELNEYINKIKEEIVEFDLVLDSRNEKEESVGSKERDIPNYSEYLVDNDVEHNLYEDFTYKRPERFKINDYEVGVRDWKDLFIKTLDYLGDVNNEILMSFADNYKMNGKKRIYFSRVELPTMIASRKLKSCEIYVETNLSANSIRTLIIRSLKEYKIKLTDYKVYLRADYSDLHK